MYRMKLVFVLVYFVIHWTFLFLLSLTLKIIILAEYLQNDTDQKNSKFWRFSRSVISKIILFLQRSLERRFQKNCEFLLMVEIDRKHNIRKILRG